METAELENKVLSAFNSMTSGVSNPQQWLLDAVSGGQSSSGVRVGVSEALSLPAVWNSIFRIAGHIGMLPVEIRRPTNTEYQTSTLMPQHPAAKVLNGANERQTGQIFRETLMANALLQGNGKAYIERNTLGQPIDLLLLPPAYTYTMMWEGEKWHILNLPREYIGDQAGRYTEAPGAPPNGWYRIPDSEVLHIPGLSYDGLWGIDVLFNSRDTFGLDAAGQDAAGYSFRNNGRPGLLLEAPRNAFSTAKQAKEFIDQFNEMHSGLDNTGKTALIRDGMKAHTLPTSAVESQHIENRSFSREDIALLFGTESVMGEGSAVYKDRQDRMLAYLQNCLARWFARWNHEAQRKLFSERDRMAGVFLEFDVRPLIAGDPNTLADYTGKLMQQGVVSVNEIRAMHKLNPVPNGDDVITMPESVEVVETDQEPEEAVEEEQPQARIARAAVHRVFRSLIADEVTRVRSASRKPDFNSRWQTIYQHHRTKLTEACTEFGIDCKVAEDHCIYSEDTLQELAAVCGPNLAESVSKVTGDWKSRAKVFSDAI